MGGLYQLTKAAIQGLQSAMWGTKVAQPDGTVKDTGVQPMVDELLARLGSDAAIPLTKPLTLIAPPGQPAIHIVTQVHGDGGIVIENITNYITNITNNINIEGDVTFEGDTIIEGDQTIIYPPGDGNGINGQLQFLTGVSISGTATPNGCTIDLSFTVTPTYATLTIENGVITGAS